MRRFDPWKLTIAGIRELAEYYGIVIGVLVAVFFYGTIFYNAGLLNPTEVVSVFVAEAPLGIGLWWVLGERSRSRFSDAIDSITLGKEYDNLIVHYWVLGWKGILTKTFCAVENKDTHLAYDCPEFLEELGSKGIVHRIKHKNEPAMREYLKEHEVTLVEEVATFAELRPVSKSIE